MYQYQIFGHHFLVRSFIFLNNKKSCLVKLFEAEVKLSLSDYL